MKKTLNLFKNGDPNDQLLYNAVFNDIFYNAVRIKKSKNFIVRKKDYFTNKNVYLREMTVEDCSEQYRLKITLISGRDSAWLFYYEGEWEEEYYYYNDVVSIEKVNELWKVIMRGKRGWNYSFNVITVD